MRAERAGTALVVLLAVAVQLPFFDRGVALLDEGTVLATAEALARGEVLYRDRITVVAPLSYELLAAAFRAFGSHLVVGRAIQAAVFVACVLLTLGVLRRVTGEAWALAGALSLLALKPLGFLSWTIANYSPFGLLALLLALSCLARWLDGCRARDLALSGLASGLVFVSKQNLAAVAALAVGAAVFADWWASPPRRWRPLLARAGLLLATSLLPVAAAALHYAALCALRPASEQLIASMPGWAGAWVIPFPTLGPWSAGDPDWHLRFFAFFPQPVVELALSGGLDPSTRELLGAAELGVKLCYGLPLVAVALVAGRWLARPDRRREQSIPLACALFAAAAYASMAYRPDWAHLMNVWPLLHVAIVAAIAMGRGWMRAALAVLSALAWLGLAAAACWALAMLDWETLRTPRGELRLGRASAAALRALLAWDAQHPQGERIAFLPAVPGLHFLSGRPLPLAADALIPGLFSARDEERMLGQLENVDRVVYDARSLPWVGADTIDVAPKLSQALARQFRFTRLVAPRFPAFERITGAGRRPSLDLWDSVGAGNGGSGVQARPEHWLFYRVRAWTLSPREGGQGCIEAPWRVASGDRAVAIPMSDPSLWHPASPSRPPWIDFELTVLGPQRSPVLTRTARLSPAAGPEPWTVLVELPEGAEAVLRLCAELAAPAPRLSGIASIRAGWAEPHVERAAGEAQRAIRRRYRPARSDR
jgi:4-amino-4-deoxy-L-arabinose transferase-like glycosyltransferase